MDDATAPQIIYTSNVIYCRRHFCFLQATEGRFHQHLRLCAPDFFARSEGEAFFWRTAFGERRMNLAKSAQFLALNLEFQLLVKLSGRFFAKRRALASFCLAHKVW